MKSLLAVLQLGPHLWLGEQCLKAWFSTRVPPVQPKGSARNYTNAMIDNDFNSPEQI